MLSRLVIAFLPRSKCLLMSWLQSASAVILELKKIVSHCFHCFPIISFEVSFLNVEFYANFFHSPFSFSSRALQFLFTFCHKGGVICVSEVIDISPGSLDSSLCFIQPGILHGVLCIYCDTIIEKNVF